VQVSFAASPAEGLEHSPAWHRVCSTLSWTFAESVTLVSMSTRLGVLQIALIALTPARPFNAILTFVAQEPQAMPLIGLSALPSSP